VYPAGYIVGVWGKSFIIGVNDDLRKKVFLND